MRVAAHSKSPQVFRLVQLSTKKTLSVSCHDPLGTDQFSHKCEKVKPQMREKFSESSPGDLSLVRKTGKATYSLCFLYSLSCSFGPKKI